MLHKQPPAPRTHPCAPNATPSAREDRCRRAQNAGIPQSRRSWTWRSARQEVSVPGVTGGCGARRLCRSHQTSRRRCPHGPRAHSSRPLCTTTQRRPGQTTSGRPPSRQALTPHLSGDPTAGPALRPASAAHTAGLARNCLPRALCTNLWMAVDGLCRTAPNLCTIWSETVDTKDGLGSLQGCYLEERYLHPVHDGEHLSCPHATPQ
jgi:hypothetical protein